MRPSNMVSLLLVLVVTLPAIASGQQLQPPTTEPPVGVIREQAVLYSNRRVPYYLLPGCDFMLDAGERCDSRAFQPAIGCCPIGYECVTEQFIGRTTSTCLPSPTPTYSESPNCAAARRVNIGQLCDASTCCPDGFDCISPGEGRPSVCAWTGRPIVPSANFTTSPKQVARFADLSRFDGSPKPPVPEDRQTCSTGFVCPATTLAQPGQPTCSNAGPRWRGPSCTCYDVPTSQVMANTPPALDVSPSTGKWVIRGTQTTASIKGINWFGFNNGPTMLDGLFAGYENATLGDFPTVLKRIKLLGFNGLRLPFTFADLNKRPATRIYVDNCRADTIAQFRQSLTPNFRAVSSNPTADVAAVYTSSSACPFDTTPTEGSQGLLSTSNKHVPGRQDPNTYNRFLWVIQYAVGQGFYVVIDFHLEQEGLQNDRLAFATEWRKLWADIVSLPTYRARLSGRVFPEIANEWDKYKCAWESATSNCATSYSAQMETASSAIRDVSIAARDPPPIVLVEGVGQLGFNFNWGDGFVTDTNTIQQNGLSNPRTWFSRDRAATNSYKTVLAPHVYGPSVTFQTPAQTSGFTLWERLYLSWGSKSPAANLGAVGTRQQYAVAITEFGSDCDVYGTEGSSSTKCTGGRDVPYLNSLQAYMTNNRGVVPAQFSHNPDTVWFWWSWNANSGDTGGLVADDWYVVKWYKVRYLESLGLCPWYRARGTCFVYFS